MTKKWRTPVSISPFPSDSEHSERTNCYLDCAAPVFTRPAPATRSRSSTCTSSSNGDIAPHLSSSDGSSISERSQSSIELSQIDLNAMHPTSTAARNRARTRARGTGHRRRYSESHISRSSAYEHLACKT